MTLTATDRPRTIAGQPILLVGGLIFLWALALYFVFNQLTWGWTPGTPESARTLPEGWDRLSDITRVGIFAPLVVLATISTVTAIVGLVRLDLTRALRVVRISLSFAVFWTLAGLVFTSLNMTALTTCGTC